MGKLRLREAKCLDQTFVFIPFIFFLSFLPSILCYCSKRKCYNHIENQLKTRKPGDRMRTNPANFAVGQGKQNRRKSEGWRVTVNCLLCVEGTESENEQQILPFYL